jgi:hypothetical protein
MFVCSFLFFVSLAVLCSAQSSTGEYGWSTQAAVSPLVLSCLTAQNNATFVVYTGLAAYHNVNTGVCASLQNAKNQGIEKRDVLLVPAPMSAVSAADQISLLVDNINANCTTAWSQPRRMWIDMNSYSLWPTPWRQVGWTKNRQWFEGLVDACLARKDLTCGILSSSYAWKYTLGDVNYSYEPATNLPLRYEADDSHTASFDDFVPFGGFTEPFAKQFYYYVTNCNISVRQDWAPLF